MVKVVGSVVKVELIIQADQSTFLAFVGLTVSLELSHLLIQVFSIFVELEQS